MMKDEGIKNARDSRALRQFVESNSEEIFELPKWARVVLIMSRLVVSPLFAAPMALTVAGACVALTTRRIDLFDAVIYAVVIAAAWMGFCVAHTSREMSKDGVLGGYLSLLASNTWLGRVLVARFGSRERRTH